jgi:AGZA family xanthine/uracil permease-like MFS transporter
MKNKSFKSDFIGGLTTFLTMAYIVVVNPSVLATEGTGMSFSGVLTATVLVCFSMTLLMGLYARLPFAIAPGMGINAFFTYSVILGNQVPWPTALGMVFWSGVLSVLISVTPVRATILRAIPDGLRGAVAIGIGVFLTFIGLKNAGFIMSDPVTSVKLAKFGPEAMLSLAGFAVIVALVRRKSPLAFLVGIAGVTLTAWALGLLKAPETWIAPPDFESVFFKLDILGALKLALLPTIVSLLFTDLFDSISTFVGVSRATGLVDQNGDPIRMREGLIVDAVASLGSGVFGTSSGTAYIESAAGIEAGGRTGRASVVTALLFLPCLFLAPVLQVVPVYATAPVLVMVGALMFRGVSELKLKKIEDAVPAFLTVVLIPLTYSITQGILWGLLSHTALYTLAGRKKEISPALWAIAAMSAGLIVLEQWGA